MDPHDRSDPTTDSAADATAFSSSAVEVVQRIVEEEHGYLSWLGTRVDDIEPGRVVLTVPYDEKLTNSTDPPTVNGGIAATLVDTAGGICQRTTFDDPLSGGVATVNLNVNYLRRAGGDLTATAEVVRAGSTIGVSTVTVESTTDEGTRAVATGQAAYRLFRDGSALRELDPAERADAAGDETGGE